MLKLIFNSTYILHSDGRGVWTPSAPCDPTTVPFLSDVPTSSHIIRKIPLKIIATFCRAPNSVRGVCRFVALFVCFVCVLDYFHTQQFATMHPFTKCDHCTIIDTECLQHGGVIFVPTSASSMHLVFILAFTKPDNERTFFFYPALKPLSSWRFKVCSN